MKTLFPLAALLIAGSASAAQVWVAPAASKIRPDAKPAATAQTSARIAAAKNEFEAFHVVVTGSAAGVSMTLPALRDAAGHTISGRDVVLYRENLIYVPSPTGGDGGAGFWPDALIPDVDPIAGEKRTAFPFDVPANESRAVLVDVHAPPSAPAGTYTGTLQVSGGASAQIPVTLTVWDFEVPSTSTLKSAYHMSWNGHCLGHGDANCSGGDADRALRARYVQAALDNHVSIHTPYDGAPVDANGNGDWSQFDKYAGPFIEGTANTRLEGAKLTSVSVDGAIAAPTVKAWSAHFQQKGWTPVLFDYICDEPPLTCKWSDIGPRIAQSRGGDASMPTLVTTTSAEAQRQGASGIDLYTPVINFMEGKPGKEYAGNQRSSYGPTVWWYQSCMSFGCSGVGGGLDGTGETGWPTYAIDSDATRNRAMEWLSFTYDVQGELYYEVTMAFFGGDPWQSQTAFGGTGDGTLFYPGTPARIGGRTEIPVESLRLKGIRDGMEDYELLNLARSLGAGDAAMKIAQGVFPKTYQATSTPAAIDGARAQLAALILRALGKDTTPAGAAIDGADGAKPGAAALVGAGGCSSSGAQSLWLALPLFAGFALRRRRP